MTSGLILFNREFEAIAWLIKAILDCFKASATANTPPAAGIALLLDDTGTLYMPAFCAVPVFVKVSRLVLWVVALFTVEAAAFVTFFTPVEVVFTALFVFDFDELVDTDFFAVFDVVFTVVFTAGLAAAAVLTAIAIFFLSES